MYCFNEKKKVDNDKNNVNFDKRMFRGLVMLRFDVLVYKA